MERDDVANSNPNNEWPPENPLGVRESTAQKWFVGIMGVVAGIIGGAIGAGMWAGTAQTTLSQHVANGEVHPTMVQRYELIQKVVDREIQPNLRDLSRKIDMLQEKVDNMRDEVARMKR